MKQQRLGKGLGALIGEEAQPAAKDSVLEISVYDIDPNLNQPRKKFDDERLNELAQSIKTYGIVQPIIVQRSDDRYMIIAGERRYRAARLAGLEYVPVVIKEYSRQAFMEVSLVENLQREDLNPIEEAEAMKLLMDEYKLKQEELSERLGKSRSAIANTLRLLSLPDDVRDMVVSGELTSGHARCLIVLPGDEEKTRIAKRIVEQGLSVRATEELIKNLGTKPQQKPKPEKVYIPELESAQNSLSSVLGTKVQIAGDMKRGKILLSYYNEEQLQSLYDFLISGSPTSRET